MHSKQLHTCEATAASGMQGTDLRVYLDQLINHLDESSLRATLKLMICETRGAIDKQQGLIALERLGRRNTAGRLDQLGDLKRMQDQLVVAYASFTDPELDVAPEESLHGHPVGQAKVGQVNNQVLPTFFGAATRPASSPFPKLAVGITKREQQDVGRVVGRKPQEEPERAPGGDRQSRHASGAAR